MSEPRSEENRAGQCLCGAVRFSVRGAEADVGACHCKMCQRWTGSALLTVTVPAEGFEVLAGEDELKTYASSPWAARTFCDTCGSGLYYEVTAPGPHQGARYLAAGTLDDLEGLRLGHEIFHDRRSPVFDYAGDTTKKTEAEVMAEFGGG